MQRDGGGADSAQRDLSLRANVDDAGPKAQSDAAAGKQIGCRAIERKADLVRRSERAFQHGRKSGERIVAGQRDEKRGRDDGKRGRRCDSPRHRIGEAEPQRPNVREPGALCTRRRIRHAARPDIQRPIWPISASSRIVTPAKPSVGHHGDAVGDLEHFLELGGEIENRRAVLTQSENALQHEPRRARVEPPGRLMCDQHRGPPIELPRDHDLLLVAAG